MGYRIVAALAGLRAEAGGPGLVHVEDPLWHGYLANIGPAAWAAGLRDQVPESMLGAHFLAQYGGSTDTVTRIDPARSYAIRQPTAHPIHEHDRVRRFRALLESGRTDDAALTALGTLMYESHASYSACGLGATGTDRLVALVREAGPSRGLFGAKITGGGSGGTVAVLARPDSRPAIEDIATRYMRETGRTASVIGGSSDGAIRFGVRRHVVRS